MLKIGKSKSKELCQWPRWLDRLYANPDELRGRVRIFSHPQHGYVYALGPSEGIWDEKTSIIEGSPHSPPFYLGDSNKVRIKWEI